MVLSDEVPIRTHLVPFGSIPPEANSQSVPMPANTSEFTPGPLIWTVVMILLPQVPIRAHTLPMSVKITEISSQAICMHTNTSIFPPDPASSPMQKMVVIIALPQMPIRADLVPACSIPSHENFQPVAVSADTAEFPPPPSTWLVVVVSLPQVPV